MGMEEARAAFCRLTMAAISHVFTIRRAAEILGQDEELIWQVSDDMEPEDGVLWVYDTGNPETRAFTADGIDALRELISERNLRSR